MLAVAAVRLRSEEMQRRRGEQRRRRASAPARQRVPAATARQRVGADSDDGERRRGCDAMNGAVARCRPVGCAISTKSRRRDGAIVEIVVDRVGPMASESLILVYLRYELLSGRRRYLPIECTLGALIRVR
ncbi:hypothetical protein Scep_001215 [Stephania cephalantha]|uniref:Uncharacterized protein n=1 Tax=Stephania cephalantha TaxID=152367 RepID=A0AAP0LBC6_9MAGN